MSKSKQRGRKRELKEGLAKGRKKIRDEIIKKYKYKGGRRKRYKKEKENQGGKLQI
jgi:hypothetical protein